mmetsp:Transcript_129879/g.225749  ORF Transcript_129879/g.225749 Transcript_129879/m.225749 type:complete len:954 (-) Transcript_129879:292-3153(-)
MPTEEPPARVYDDSSLNQLSLEYSHTELVEATKNFDSSHQLGHGSYGGVFRGIQKDGTEVAIKVLDVPEEAGFEEEVKVLSKFRHPNLVILMGFARQESKRFLIYELLAGGDVYRRLQRSCTENVPFNWRGRVSAAFDASCGLSHLHHATPKVFHRDIKSPNILLDRNGTAKMADFGLACLSNHATHKVKQPSGTVGYACPYYVQRGVVDEGSEVYSFGIVLLELLTASPPAYLAFGADGNQHYQFLVSHINNDARVGVAMADVKASWPQHVASQVIELALRCTQMQEELRPGFAEVVNLLRVLRDAPESPPGAVAASGAQVHYEVSSEAGMQNASHVGNWNMSVSRGGPGAQVMLAHGGAAIRKPSPEVQESMVARQEPVVQRQVFIQQRGSSLNGGYAGQTGQARLPGQQLGVEEQQAWSVSQTFRLCGEGEESRFAGQARLLDMNVVNSVSSAVDHLNRGSMVCQEGYCVVFSASNRAYFILFRLEMKEFVQAKFLIYEEEPVGGAGGIQHGKVIGQTHVATHHVERHPVLVSPAAVCARPSHLPVAPTLWTLECTLSEGTNLDRLAPEQRVLIHRQEPNGPLCTTFRVGRLFQEEFFNTVVQDEEMRSLLSREHFQIWAEEMSWPGAPPTTRTACSFFLTNFTTSGTLVNGTHLQKKGEEVSLHDGDIIALPRVVPTNESMMLSPFLTFRFDLSTSILGDADASAASDAAPAPKAGAGRSRGSARLTASPSRGSPSRKKTVAAQSVESRTPSAPPPAAGPTAVPAAAATASTAADDPCLGTSFVGADFAPLFQLEAGGPGVRSTAPPELRRIVHGRPANDETELCPPLLLGRAQQSSFWQRLLHEEAYNSLSRQHLQIEAWEESPGELSFCVKNLSDLNPIRVCTSPTSGLTENPAMQKDEKRLLCHGDMIVVNPSKDNMLFLVFRHISAGRLAVPPADAGSGGYPNAK